MSQRRRLPNSFSYGGVDGWKWDCRRLMLLDVSMCLVVLFSDFGINTNPERFCVQKTCSLVWPTTSYNTRRRPFSSSFRHEGEETTTCAAALLQTTSHQEEESPYYGAKSSSQCRSVRKRHQRCVRSLNGTTAKETAYAGQNMFLDAATMGFCAVHRRVQIYNGE
ncbi:hypothetical protein TNCV_5048921 [Trichonephila clavipes]|nr:hypothetical protein TNCV_5048921 [Trichonephila clavipes]